MKSTISGLLITVIVVVSVLTFSSCEKVLGGRVTYHVRGTADNFNVFYINEYRDTMREDKVAADWEYSFDAKRKHPLFFSAVSNEPAGSVIVTIFIDGREFRRIKAEGAFETATASGDLKVLF